MSPYNRHIWIEMVSDWLDANQEDGRRKDRNQGANNNNRHGRLHVSNSNGLATSVVEIVKLYLRH